MLEIITELDKNLYSIIQDYGFWIYVLMFTSIFCKTGIVVFPFFPGDTLLVAVGVLVSNGTFDFLTCYFILSASAILGGMFNYAMGKYLGTKMLNIKLKKRPLISPKVMMKTTHFLDKYGDKTVLFARWIPVIRSFTPFVAGMGRMNYLRFLAYNTLGALLWVGGGIGIGYFFGDIFK